MPFCAEIRGGLAAFPLWPGEMTGPLFQYLGGFEFERTLSTSVVLGTVLHGVSMFPYRLELEVETKCTIDVLDEPSRV